MARYATDAQVEYITKLSEGSIGAQDLVETFCYDNEADEMPDLTTKEASALIDELKALRRGDT